MGSRLEKNSNLVRKRIEGHTFDDEQGDEYEGSKFGGFPEYFRRKKIKLQNLDAELRAHSNDKPQIFKGVVCHVNGYTQPSLNDLHALVVQHGGGFMQYLDGKTTVTHVIASNLTPKKKEEFRRYRIVKPAWIVDSVNAGKLLPWDKYRVVDEGVGQKVLGFENGQITSQVNRQRQGYKEQTDTSWYTSQLKTGGSNTTGSLGRPSASNGTSSRAPPRLTQTVTPIEDIEDDDFPLPDITSSMEQALADFPTLSAAQSEAKQTPGDFLEVKTSIQTPPPSSPPLGPLEPDDSGKAKAAEDEPDEPRPQLRPRKGSQEPDYSMAIVRDSEKLRAVSPSRLAQMTAEEHNALLLSDPRIRKSTVVNPDFLEQYYRESRLHHLSTWKAHLKSQLQALTAEKSSSQKARAKQVTGQRRYIMHVDFDSFFAAVSLKKHPEYMDKPAVVAHGGGTGSEIASCNYPARKYGVKNGMWMRRALDLCPELKVLPYEFAEYESCSRKFYDSILATGGVVQSVSIDEALVDISTTCIAEGGTDGVKRSEGSTYREERQADTIAQKMRDEVFEKTGCNVSIGIGGNILLAKVALRKAKPAGQYHLKPDEVLDFIGKLEVQALPGVAWSTGGKLEDIGIKLVKDIREFSREKLINTLGPKTGEKIWEYARGIDKTEVGDQAIRKSVSAEVNWGVRFENQEQVDEFMQGLCGELHKRLVKERVKGKQLTMKVMRRAANAPLDPPKHLGHGKCDTYNKSLQLGVSTNDAALITKEAIAMMKSFNVSPGELRGIGVQMQKLEPLKAEGAAESSQRRLHFKIGQASTTTEDTNADTAAIDEIRDDLATPEKQRFRDADHPNLSTELYGPSTPSKKPLNTMGTQFLMPTQVDPRVLEELPEDIRAKLAKHIKPGLAAAPPPKPEPKKLRLEPVESKLPSRPSSRAQSPAPAFQLPNHSQLDPSILEALPEDVRAEILGFYRSPSKKRGEQAVLPQSPRKNRTLPPTKQPLRRRRGGGAITFASRLRNADNPTLTQSNFIARPQPAQQPNDDSGAGTDADTNDSTLTDEALDPEFLAALPEDIRSEVLAQQKQARLQRTGGIDTSLHQRPRGSRLPNSKKKAEEDAASLDRFFALPPRTAKPAFTTAKLTEVLELRKAITAWFREFSDEAPYGEDVEALGQYVRDVVTVERDLGKAVGVVDWMGWVVEEGEGVGGEIREAWEQAVERVKGAVREGARQRGMGRVEFG
ncbi:hypothetical protein MBLNU230_g8151t1 [Neophaeotheca triangularis]